MTITSLEDVEKDVKNHERVFRENLEKMNRNGI